MERTSPKRIIIDAAVLEAQKVNEQLILAEGLAERSQVSVKEEKIESRWIAQRAQVNVKEAADWTGKKSSAEGFHKDAAMRQHCGTQKHKVFDSAQVPLSFDVHNSFMLTLCFMFTLCCKQNNCGIPQRAEVSVKEAADREKNETLAAGDCKRAEEAQATSCEAHAIDEAIHASGLHVHKHKDTCQQNWAGKWGCRFGNPRSHPIIQ